VRNISTLAHRCRRRASIVEDEIAIVGMFSQNGFQTIKEGAPVDIVFDNAPGRI